MIVFAETGLVIAPFLPGDSLLFAIGALAATDGSPLSMAVVLGLLVVAAILGDAVNYSIGYRVGFFQGDADSAAAEGRAVMVYVDNTRPERPSAPLPEVVRAAVEALRR